MGTLSDEFFIEPSVAIATVRLIKAAFVGACQNSHKDCWRSARLG
ncbi:hypothetical protein BN1221_01309c [Brenneria goodwinii]|uniref:Uncharacterized protein n=1 Tax=Brenneria goodwinii TaxID=1109412 RepID=A0A0G4JT30_9GAMM|nr:hypothetical protein BN1221_01309c [Brenneria goodwinii]